MRASLAFGLASMLVVSFLATRTAHGQDEKPEGLVHVAPVPIQEEDQARPLDRVFGPLFQPARWEEWLESPDLDEREGAFEDLLRRARLDAVARAFIEELARDDIRPGLAWTARLALRELGRGNFPLHGVTVRGVGGNAALEEMLQGLWGRHGGLEFFSMPRKRVRVMPRLSVSPGSGGAARSVQLEQGPDGAKIVITEEVDGQDQVREYTGESLEAILEQNPQLSEQVGGVQILVQGGVQELFLDPFRYGDQRGGGGPRRWQEQERLFSPTGPSRPVRTDLLGVLAVRLKESRRQELGLGEGVGLVVRTVLEGTLAHLMGVRAGDVLIEMNGESLTRVQEITERMNARASGDPISLTWIDDLGNRKRQVWEEQ